MKETLYCSESKKIFRRDKSKRCGYHGCRTWLTIYQPNEFCFAHAAQANSEILDKAGIIRSSKRLLKLVQNEI